MNIGELFLNLGVKGTEKSVEQVSQVSKSVGELGSTSLEAKAALIGAMYALEQLFATSGKAGTELTNFNALTGDSVQTLQKYQYAARQVGISNEEVKTSFEGLQSKLSQAAYLGQNSITGLAHVSNVLHKSFTQANIQEFAKHPEKLIQILQEYAQKEKNIGLGNETLKSFGLSGNFIAGLRRNAFNQPTLNQAPTYSDKEIAQLDKANIAWSNLSLKIEMAVGHFNALHGGALVKEISGVVTQVIKLTESFVKLSEKVHLFEGIGKVFAGWGDIFELISSTIDKVTGDKKGIEHGLVNQGTQIGSSIINEGSYFANLGKDYLKNLFTTQNIGNGIVTAKQFLNPSHLASLLPPSLHTQNQSSHQNNNITITNNFQHPGLEHKKTGDSVKQSVNQALRQISSITQGA